MKVPICDFLLDFLLFTATVEAYTIETPVEQNEAEDKESPKDGNNVQESKV